jgi:hypothetical protein
VTSGNPGIGRPGNPRPEGVHGFPVIRSIPALIDGCRSSINWKCLNRSRTFWCISSFPQKTGPNGSPTNGGMICMVTSVASSADAAVNCSLRDRWRITSISCSHCRAPCPWRIWLEISNPGPADGFTMAHHVPRISNGRRDMGFSPSARVTRKVSSNTSTISGNITGQFRFKMNTGAYWRNMGFRTTNDMCGTELPQRIPCAPLGRGFFRALYQGSRWSPFAITVHAVGVEDSVSQRD